MKNPYCIFSENYLKMSETLNDMMSANVVIIHPGSLYLRIGKGSDTSPTKIVHAIARRRKPEGVARQDPLLIPQESYFSIHSFNIITKSGIPIWQLFPKLLSFNFITFRFQV
jgi:hypothetical protein